MGSTRRAILPLSVVFTAVGFVSPSGIGGAQLAPRACVERGCPERAPSNNGELVGTFGLGGNSHTSFRAFPETNRVPFGGTFTFYYGVLRQSVSRPGAIAVRVVKVYRQPQRDNPWLNQTLLYRNKFDDPDQRDQFDGSIDRTRYSRWHQGENITSERLRTEFHVEFRQDERTSEPPARRRSFVFQSIGDHDHDAVVQRAYLLGYGDVRPDGTWIDFTSNFSNAYSEVYVTIIDLDSDAPRQWSWRFENSSS